MAGCEDLGGPGAGPGPAGGAARPGRVKSPLVFLRPVLRSALLCWEIVLVAFTAPPLDLHSNTKLLQRMMLMMMVMMNMTILMSMMMTIVMITKSEKEL